MELRSVSFILKNRFFRFRNCFHIYTPNTDMSMRLIHRLSAPFRSNRQHSDVNQYLEDIALKRFILYHFILNHFILNHRQTIYRKVSPVKFTIPGRVSTFRAWNSYTLVVLALLLRSSLRGSLLVGHDDWRKVGWWNYSIISYSRNTIWNDTIPSWVISNNLFGSFGRYSILCCA